MTKHTSTPEQRADAVATDIERVAAFVRANPEVAFEIGNQRFVIGLSCSDDPKEDMAALVRAGLRAGATVDKNVTDKWAGVDLRFGCVTVDVFARRDQVCERVVVGTREETVEEPDPEALAKVPTVAKKITVEDVRWECTPLLAAQSTEDAS